MSASSIIRARLLALPSGFFGPAEVAYEVVTSTILTRRDLLSRTACRSVGEVDELLERLPVADLGQGRTSGGVAIVVAVDPSTQRAYVRVTLPAGRKLEEVVSAVPSAQALLGEWLGMEPGGAEAISA